MKPGVCSLDYRLHGIVFDIDDTAVGLGGSRWTVCRDWSIRTRPGKTALAAAAMTASSILAQHETGGTPLAGGRWHPVEGVLLRQSEVTLPTDNVVVEALPS
jgi:hypothetical protein